MKTPNRKDLSSEAKKRTISRATDVPFTAQLAPLTNHKVLRPDSHQQALTASPGREVLKWRGVLTDAVTDRRVGGRGRGFSSSLYLPPHVSANHLPSLSGPHRGRPGQVELTSTTALT
ncbi:hypothetical protein ACOMHN_013034 [Nucella lapillus]